VRPDDAAKGSRLEARAALRALPPVQRMLEAAATAALLRRASRPAVTAALRAALDGVRAEVLIGGALPPDSAIIARAEAALLAQGRPQLRRVLNATGIVLHTNLGRAPLPDAAIRAVVGAARGYANVEYDLEAGARGSRTAGIEPLLRALTGAEAALAVNNCAAAVLLALSAHADGGEVIVSRGELVEIGGGFRIPDVIQQGGARLVEVGTTNKTRIADYAAAITPHTRALLKVHHSNYRIVGFTAEATRAELAALAKARGLLLMEDLGSGTLADLRAFGRPHEPTVGESLAGGVDLLMFSGDKLLGGPQAGLLVGTAAAIDPLRRHPLLRAVRLDKLVLAALEATLRLYLDAGRAAATVPVLRMLAQTPAGLDAQAERLRALLAPLGDARCVASVAYAGGGALPGSEIASRAVAFAAPGVSPDTLARRLRAQRPAVVGRIADGALLLDMMTLADAEVAPAAAAIAKAVAFGP
jgi:L-seryl-tRNA(Ser) seleniumtransferase